MRDCGRDEEFTSFVMAAGTHLERAALLLTGDPYLAEDLVQVTYAKVFASWRKVHDNAVGYARATLLNTYISHKRLRRNTELPVDLVRHRDESEHDTDAATRLDVLDALATLGAVDRAVVVLRYWEDRSVADTALDLNLSQVAVRTRARRALQRLRPLLDTDERTVR